MKRKFTIPALILLIILTACGKYKTYPTAEKITLVTETSATVVTTVTTISASITVVTEKQDEQNLSECVYYTKSGKRYHYENPCGRGTYYECTLDEAIAKGLTPCDKCVK